ncbi:kinase-like domain-containing protein [Roridomyces roridus]|uniref:non-specific serine/threonine protein kinase n=1 Tax=Roridomyces roridus TaxID=1738132 RepID=A0AAD7FH00_9AGAR|nr:kinase-like domain-containing protein [Roridomyces roridus]
MSAGMSHCGQDPSSNGNAVVKCIVCRPRRRGTEGEASADPNTPVTHAHALHSPPPHVQDGTERFLISGLDGIEWVEDYRPGGFHLISIGDEFGHGRYRIIHKLGFGGSSTIWLARDQRSYPGTLVTLKAMRASASSKSPNDLPEITIPGFLQAVFPQFSDHFQSVQDHFVVQGPIKVAKQTTNALYRMHTAGFAHGDLTTSNILFRLSKEVLGWSDKEVYSHFGSPETEEVVSCDGRPRETNAPATLVEPIAISKFTHASLVEENILLIDFGQSYSVTSPPEDYMPGTAMNYISPETVETLGRLPDPWGSSFEKRTLWFEEDGRPRDADRLKSSESSIRGKLRSIGTEKDLKRLTRSGYKGPMLGVKMSEEEVELLGDLLEKMLRYLPEERIRIEEVVRHPWFQMELD